jgi:TorA maturation chaperone TorD
LRHHRTSTGVFLLDPVDVLTTGGSIMASTEIFTENGLSAMSRGNVYLLLSRLYSGEADRELVEWLRSEEAVSALDSLGVDVAKMVPCPAEGSAKGSPEGSPQVYNDGLEEIIDELAEEYTGLFVLPGGLSPYESVRITGQFCQEPEWQVRKFYQDSGLVINDDRKIFADHIGAEFGFMGFLAEKEFASWDSGDGEEALKYHGLQAEFFNAHLSGWTFAFLDDLERLAEHKFYKEVAVLTRRFLELEKQELVAPTGR